MKKRVLVFGEILFDLYPGYKRLGGAPCNFAFHLHQFGMDVTFISRIGEDAAGREILQLLRQFAFPTPALHTLLQQAGQPSLIICDMNPRHSFYSNEILHHLRRASGRS